MAAEQAAPPVLGLPGDLVTPQETLSHYNTKAGGLPHFPGNCLPPAAHLKQRLACGVCSAPLSLVLQAFSPVDSAPERVLHLWGCTRPGCGCKPGSWKATRCQLPAPKPAPPPAQASQPPSAVPAQVAASSSGPAKAAVSNDPASFYGTADGFGAGGFGDDGGGFGAGAAGGFGDFGFEDSMGECSNAADAQENELSLKDLGAALDVAAAAAAAGRTTQQGGKGKGKGGAAAVADASASGSSAWTGAASGEPAPSCRLDDAGVACSLGALLPEFHIYAAEEPQGAGPKIRNAEMQHIQKLLQAYEQEESQAHGRVGGAAASSSSTAAASGAGGSRGKGRGRGANTANADGDQGSDDDVDMDAASEPESWGAEEWEEDAARGITGGYLRFSKRLAACPEQCVRYQPGGAPLWPLEQLPSPGKCAHCGAPRAFELQLLAPAIAVLLDCVEWLEPHQLPTYAAGINAAGNWDLVTVAVFTCSRSCWVEQSGAAGEPGAGTSVQAGAECCMAEELALMVLEEECHLKQDERHAYGPC